MTDYDPLARRDTPLALKLKQRIRRNGPIRMPHYMAACLFDSEHGYYTRQPAIGARGDFITAPEISQVFGELIGLWCAVVWQQMGSPVRVNLVELGPGRGTMMRDAIRAAAKVPGFVEAVRVVLIERSPTLRAIQSEMTQGLQVTLVHASGPDAPELDRSVATIVVANEVIDCLPITQLEWVSDDRGRHAWHPRTVALDDAGQLVFALAPAVGLRAGAADLLPVPRPGDILEDRNARGLVEMIAGPSGAGPVAALLVDYGHLESGYGDTLQAARNHAFEHPLTSPGEADLTAQVDFAAFAALVAEHSASPGVAPLVVDGPVTQAEFLGALGIMERTSRLMAANPARAGEIEVGVARLMAVPGMGSRFKAIGIRSPDLPPLPGFPVDRREGGA